MLMDLVPAADQPVNQWWPAIHPATAEGGFLRLVGDAFLRVGRLHSGDLDALEERLAHSDFLRQRIEGPEIGSAAAPPTTTPDSGRS